MLGTICFRSLSTVGDRGEMKMKVLSGKVNLGRKINLSKRKENLAIADGRKVTWRLGRVQKKKTMMRCS